MAHSDWVPTREQCPKPPAFGMKDIDKYSINRQIIRK